MEKVKRGRDRRIAGQVISADKGAFLMGVIIFALITYLSLREPTLAFGEAIGMANVAVVLGAGLVAVLLTCACLHYMINRERWDFRVLTVYFFIGIAMSIAVNDALLKFVDSRYAFAESVVQNKIRYYCITAYNPAQCVNNLSLCPDCKDKFTKQERTELHAKLVIFQAKIDREYEMAEQARRTGPISEALQRSSKRGPASK